MMKKHVFLITILVIAAAANADISLNSPSALVLGDTGTIEIVSDNASEWSGMLILEYDLYGDYTLSNPVSLPASGYGVISESIGLGAPQAYVCELGEGYRFTTKINVPFEPVQPGVQHTVDITSNSGGVCRVSLWDEAKGFEVPVDYMSIYMGSDPGDDWSGAYAHAGGPYSIDAGETITLSGYRSYGQSSQWSIGGIVIGEDLLQEITYDQLVNGFGLATGTHQLQLRVEGFNGTEYDFTTIEIIPEPATVMLLAFAVTSRATLDRAILVS